MQQVITLAIVRVDVVHIGRRGDESLEQGACLIAERWIVLACVVICMLVEVPGAPACFDAQLAALGIGLALGGR